MAEKTFTDSTDTGEQKNGNIPVDVNLKEDSFSSNTHPTELFGAEAADYSGSDYEIPISYNIDLLRLLPVNVNTVYLFWEITDKITANAKFETFALKLYEIADLGEREIIGFYFKERVSGKYINAHMPSKNLFAAIGGIDENGRFVELLRSNKIKTPNDKISYMTDNEEAWLSKKSEWVELVRASTSHFSHAKSSMSLVKEMELLKKFSEKSLQTSMSSFDLAKKD